MAIEALPFVNWIFWAALSSGTLLVVGLTEAIGGTTRGYRMFMACLLVAFAGILVASDLALPSGVQAAATTDVRRPLTLAFGAGCIGYLVASIAGWPRALLAVATGIVGMAALVVLAVAGGTQSGALFASQLVVTAVALGAVNAAMLLGHWYLVTPKLSPAPLRRMMWLLIGSLALQGILFGLALLLVGTDPLGGPIGWLTWLRLAVGILLPIGITVLAMLASRAASLQ